VIEISVRSIVGAWVVLALACTSAQAKSRQQRPVHRFDVSFGAGVFGGADLSSSDAALRANSVTPQPYRVFSADWHISSSRAVEGRVGFALTHRVGVEGRFGFNRPDLRATIENDVEGASALTIVEPIDQYVIDAGVVVMLDELRVGQFVPFVTAGGGYVRQLHEGRTVVDEGRAIHLGAGVKRWFVVRRRGAITGAGVRGDVELQLMSGGIELEEGLQPHATVSGSFFVTF
jgi:hypothetical protein